MIQTNLQIQTGSNLMEDTFLYHDTSLEASHFYLRSAMLQEEWKPVKGYEGLYEISNMGLVKSLYRKYFSGMNYQIEKTLPEKILIANIQSNYLYVNLYNNKSVKKFRIHHLVWDHFGDRPRNGRKLQIDHIDNNTLNCRIDNLQLLTSRENIHKSVKLNKRSGLPIGVGWFKPYKKFRARIKTSQGSKWLGYFDTAEEASKAYQNYLSELDAQAINEAIFNKEESFKK